MRQTELILFVVVMLINGGIALYKKHKQREAERAAKSLENLATKARDEAKRTRPAPARSKPAKIRPTSAPASARVASAPRPVVPAIAVPPVAIPTPPRAAPAPPVAPIGIANVARSRRALGSRAALRQAVIASEVLGRPRADRPLGA
jgi:hypothetical protein